MLFMCCMIYIFCNFQITHGLKKNLCQGEWEQFGCKNEKVIKVTAASYYSIHGPVNCSVDYAFTLLSRLCNGANICLFPVEDYMFHGQCLSVDKCILVEYKCIQKSHAKCGYNQKFVDCKSACPAFCPINGQEQPRDCIKMCSGTGCECKESFVRDQRTGFCINKKYCPFEGEKNEVFHPCNAEIQERCFIEKDISSSRCTPGYICRNGYKRDRSGICVRASQCPKNC